MANSNAYVGILSFNHDHYFPMHQSVIISQCINRWYPPQYTRGWLYVFVPVRMPPPDFCLRDNFWTTFSISFVFGTLVGPDLKITWLDFGRFSSWPWPIFKVKYGICYISAKNGPIATKQKVNISIELWASNVTIGFDLGHNLDLEFSRSNMEFAISQPKVVRLPQNERQTYRLDARPQMWPSSLTLTMTLTLNFQGQIWNLLYLSQKWSDCHKTKKQTYRMNSRPQMWPMGLILAVTLIFEFSRSNVA